MYSNDEIMKQLNQKDDTYFGKSEKECYGFCLNV